MPYSAAATQDTPLAPSVEKAYYRKCIELKRRLNEVEASNDDYKKKRMRLDRAIMKMRLERAFLLDELRKRMEYNVDGSEGSGDEEMERPPPDRPHRDKRRRQPAPQPATSSAGAFQTPFAASAQRTGSDPNLTAIPGGAAAPDDGRYAHGEPATSRASSGPAPLPHGSPYGHPPTGLPSGTPHGQNGANHDHDAEERGGTSAESGRRSSGDLENGDAGTN